MKMKITHKNKTLVKLKQTSIIWYTIMCFYKQRQHIAAPFSPQFMKTKIKL